MSEALAVRPSVDEALSERSVTLTRLREARRSIAGAAPATLVEMMIWADALAAAAKVKRASDVLREAAETRVRAERRLGELLDADDSIAASLMLSPGTVKNVRALAAVPTQLFERAAKDLLDREKACAACSLLDNARRQSLRRVESGIWVAWDDTYYVERGVTTGGARTKRRTVVYGGLIDAREDLRRSAGLSRSWRDSPESARLDQVHARARKLAQALSILGPDLGAGRERRALVAKAELMQMEVADLLFQAWKAAT